MFLISSSSTWHENPTRHTESKDITLETPATRAIIAYLMIQLVLFDVLNIDRRK